MERCKQNEGSESRINNLRSAVIPYLTSTSHNETHSQNVANFTSSLARLHVGDIETVQAAAWLHDLGRGDANLHGLDSINKSLEIAPYLLRIANYSEEQIESVLTAISEHDQPNLVPTTKEGLILKEADYLDGVGARGILRTLAWTTESGEPSSKAIERLGEKMQKRIASLTLPESKRYAQKVDPLVRLFLARLENPPDIESVSYPGKYIVLEGISGNGKDTQAVLLRDHLERDGNTARIVCEPSTERKQVRQDIRNLSDNSWLDIFSHLVDRVVAVDEEIRPALRTGEIVIGVRSFLSTLVYQTDSKEKTALVHLLHNQFTPSPDLIINLEVEPDVALQRITQRYEQTGKPISRFENLEDLMLYAQRYAVILHDFQTSVNVDGSGSIDEVAEEIVNVVYESGCLT